MWMKVLAPERPNQKKTGRRWPLDFRLLRYFVAVAEELHLARAAERLGIEQSPVSRAMRDLENQLGVQLFDHPSTRDAADLGRPGVPRRCRRAGYRGAGSQERQGGGTGLPGPSAHRHLRQPAQPRIATFAGTQPRDARLEIRVFKAAVRAAAQRCCVDLLDIGFCVVKRGA